MLPSLLQRPPAPQPFKSPLGNSFLRPCPLLQPPATPRLQALQAKPTKAVDFRGLSDDEIDQEVDKCQRELFRLRFVQARREVRPFRTGCGGRFWQRGTTGEVIRSEGLVSQPCTGCAGIQASRVQVAEEEGRLL